MKQTMTPARMMMAGTITALIPAGNISLHLYVAILTMKNGMKPMRFCSVAKAAEVASDDAASKVVDAKVVEKAEAATLRMNMKMKDGTLILHMTTTTRVADALAAEKVKEKVKAEAKVDALSKDPEAKEKAKEKDSEGKEKAKARIPLSLPLQL